MKKMRHRSLLICLSMMHCVIGCGYFDAKTNLQPKNEASPSRVYSGASSCTCGLDISKRLRDFKVEAKATFDTIMKLNPKKMYDLCDKMISTTGFDIEDLAHTEGLGKNSGHGCGNYDTKCSATVTMDGKCYFAGEVNYFLWGYASRYCYEKRNHDIKHSLEAAQLTVVAYRIYRDVFTAYDAIPGRIEWTKSGWNAYDQVDDRLTAPNYQSAQFNFPLCKYEKDRKFNWYVDDLMVKH